MLRLIQIGSSLPFSFPVDPNAEFQPGAVGQLYVEGNQIVCGVSDGTAPIGILDDIKTNAFTKASIDEEVIIAAVGVESNGQLVTASDLKTELQYANVLERSFTADVEVVLIAKNGVILIPAGTPLNYDGAGTGTPDSVRVVVSYTYSVPNIPGDDTTQSSGRVTVWFQRIIVATDQFETNQRYPLNANLFVNESGLFTTRQLFTDQAAIGIVTAPPGQLHDSIELILL